VFGTLFGEQALRLVILVFLVLRFRARLRFFPLSQQALAVLALLLNDRVVAAAIRCSPAKAAAAAVLAGAADRHALWPWLFLLLDDLRLRLRSREG
jgi:rod shape-determining protein MreD